MDVRRREDFMMYTTCDRILGAGRIYWRGRVYSAAHQLLWQDARLWLDRAGAQLAALNARCRMEWGVSRG